MGTKTTKTVTSNYCVADAIENGLSMITELRDELQDWYDNLPESFQNGDKGGRLEEAIASLEQCSDEQLSMPDCIASAANDNDDEEKAVESRGYVGGVRFTLSLSTKKRKSRADRRDEAVALLQGALDAIRSEIECEKAGEDGDPFAETRDEIETFCDDLETGIGEAEGVEFPGMYG